MTVGRWVAAPYKEIEGMQQMVSTPVLRASYRAKEAQNSIGCVVVAAGISSDGVHRALIVKASGEMVWVDMEDVNVAYAGIR